MAGAWQPGLSELWWPLAWAQVRIVRIGTWAQPRPEAEGPLSVQGCLGPAARVWLAVGEEQPAPPFSTAAPGLTDAPGTEASLAVWPPPPSCSPPALRCRHALCRAAGACGARTARAEWPAPWWDLSPPRSVFVNLNFN